MAKRQAVTNPDRTVRLGQAAHGRVVLALPGRRQGFSPSQISAFILQKLKRDAEAYLGDQVTQAVITVPAYFDDAQRQAAKEAGEVAGLEVLRIINEPTAASLAYSLDKESDETILVFDLGGGTYRRLPARHRRGGHRVSRPPGTYLGGDDWDQRIVEWLLTTFKNNATSTCPTTRWPCSGSRRRPRRPDRALLHPGDHDQPAFITATPEGPLHMEQRLTRGELRRMTSDLVERLRVPFDKAVTDWKAKTQKA